MFLAAVSVAARHVDQTALYLGVIENVLECEITGKRKHDKELKRKRRASDRKRSSTATQFGRSARLPSTSQGFTRRTPFGGTLPASYCYVVAPAAPALIASRMADENRTEYDDYASGFKSRQIESAAQVSTPRLSHRLSLSQPRHKFPAHG